MDLLKNLVGWHPEFLGTLKRALKFFLFFTAGLIFLSPVMFLLMYLTE